MSQPTEKPLTLTKISVDPSNYGRGQFEISSWRQADLSDLCKPNCVVTAVWVFDDV